MVNPSIKLKIKWLSKNVYNEGSDFYFKGRTCTARDGIVFEFIDYYLT